MRHRPTSLNPTCCTRFDTTLHDVGWCWTSDFSSNRNRKGRVVIDTVRPGKVERLYRFCMIFWVNQQKQKMIWVFSWSFLVHFGNKSLSPNVVSNMLHCLVCSLHPTLCNIAQRCWFNKVGWCCNLFGRALTEFNRIVNLKTSCRKKFIKNKASLWLIRSVLWRINSHCPT